MDDQELPVESNNAGKVEPVAAPVPVIQTPDHKAPDPQTEDIMEVHHHAHSGHGKKNWKSYLWEFLMLFLAVFCGFLAEWKLEQVIEHHREEQFVQSLVNDVRSDKANIAIIEKAYTRINGRVDSLLSLLAGDELFNNSYPGYYHWLRAFQFPDFKPNEGTTRQLLSSGGLRLIRKSDVVDSMMSYVQMIEAVRIHQNIMNGMLGKLDRLPEMFDLRAFASGKNTDSVPMLSTDKALLSWAYGQAIYWKNTMGWLRSRIDAVKARGDGLTNVIKQEYKIE